MVNCSNGSRIHLQVVRNTRYCKRVESGQFHYSSLTPGSVHEADNCNTYQPCSVSADTLHATQYWITFSRCIAMVATEKGVPTIVLALFVTNFLSFLLSYLFCKVSYSLLTEKMKPERKINTTLYM